MKIDYFAFYKVLKNEDANPFVKVGDKEGIIAVADGLGGSGSFVHELSAYDQYRLYDDLAKTFLSEYYEEDKNLIKDESFEKWLKLLIEPMIDDDLDTSALWGSRIVIARFAYYVLKNMDLEFSYEKTRETIVDFIYEGMKKTATAFHLRLGFSQRQLLLPTTLVGARYNVNEDNTIKVDVVWAGDSRAYAFIPKFGLKQLTTDDEDSSGAIDNLFCIKNGVSFRTNLHYNSYLLPPKSLIFVCSDGFFDPYVPIDNIGVEAVFLDCLSKSHSFKELEENWHNHYKPTSHDDCSIAFVAFGFDSFEELKSLCSTRNDAIVSTFNNYYEYKKVVPIIDGEEENPTQYIINRANQRKAEISRLIALEIISNPDTTEAIILPEFIQIYNETKEEQNKFLKNKKEAAKLAACSRVRNYLLTDPNNVVCGFISDQSKFKPCVSSCIDRYLEMIKPIEKTKNDYGYDKVIRLREIIQAELEQTEIDGLNLVKKIQDRQIEIEEIIKSIEKQYKQLEANYHILLGYYHSDYYREANRLDELKKAIEVLSEQKVLAQKYFDALSDLKSFWDIKKIPERYEYISYPHDEGLFDEMQKAINNHISAENNLLCANMEVEEIWQEMNEKLRKYQELVEATSDDILLITIENAIDYYTPEACSKLGLPVEESVEPINVSILSDKILDCLEKNNYIFKDMLQKFMNSESPTIIDTVFNASRLRTYRIYKSIDPDEVKKTIEYVEKLLQAYTDVSSMQVYNSDNNID
ncbi:MAG: hypothetical protein GX906_04700 [Clostridiales bacterium]|nr:hypothetical protein [Clostridiales bacterium]